MTDTLDSLRARNSLLEEALRAHEEAEPMRWHEREDCDFDTQGGQRDCLRCIAAEMTRAALSDTAGRWLRERPAEVEHLKDSLAAFQSLYPGMLADAEQSLAEFRAKAEAQARAEALEEAATVATRVHEELAEKLAPLMSRKGGMLTESDASRIADLIRKLATQSTSPQTAPKKGLAALFGQMPDLPDFNAFEAALPIPEPVVVPPRTEKCDKCNGTGANNTWPIRGICGACGGSGQKGEPK